MQMITSPAGTRLAKTKAALDATSCAIDVNNAQETARAYAVALYDFHQAAKEVADELMEQGFHLQEGD